MLREMVLEILYDLSGSRMNPMCCYVVRICSCFNTLKTDGELIHTYRGFFTAV